MIFKKILKSSQKLGEISLFIDDSPVLSIAALRTRARRLKRKHNLDIVVIDYLQLLRPTIERYDNRVLEIAVNDTKFKSSSKSN